MTSRDSHLGFHEHLGLWSRRRFLRGAAAFKPFQAAYRDAFPDVRIETEDMLEEGDKVAGRWTGTASHRASVKVR